MTIKSKRGKPRTIKFCSSALDSRPSMSKLTSNFTDGYLYHFDIINGLIIESEMWRSRQYYFFLLSWIRSYIRHYLSERKSVIRCHTLRRIAIISNLTLHLLTGRKYETYTTDELTVHSTRRATTTFKTPFLLVHYSLIDDITTQRNTFRAPFSHLIDFDIPLMLFWFLTLITIWLIDKARMLVLYLSH